MPLPVYRLRRWLVVIAALFTAVVAGMYFFAHERQRNLLKEVPGKIAYDIKQTANGFQFSKSEAGRTVFIIRAGAVKEFKPTGRAELSKVSITLYGRDSSRFDQIYGDSFVYDPKTGNVTAQGAVAIDLEANPAGSISADQAPPKELKNAIHLKTSDLAFNRDTGNASTDARVDFETPQASGWAVGVRYAGRTNTLTLVSQIHLNLAGIDASTLYASSGRVTNEPRQIVLENPRLRREGRTLQAEQVTFFLGPDNSVQRVLATGNVIAEGKARGKTKAGSTSSASSQPQEEQEQEEAELRARADQAELVFTASTNQITSATLTGNVHVDRPGPAAMEGTAQRVVVDFSAGNQVHNVHATEGVRLAEHATASARPATSSAPQDFEMNSPTVDFLVANGRRLDRAITSGAASIIISSGQTVLAGHSPPASPNPISLREDSLFSTSGLSTANSSERSVVTAGKFTAKFDTASGQNRLASIHGEPDARIVNQIPGQPDRVSTSRTLNAVFLPQGGIESIVQQGSVAYNDGQPHEKSIQAWSDSARYTPADQIIVLSGHPRVADGGMSTTADSVRILRASGDAMADGNVKTTYTELKEQPYGALLASSSPIHVTAHSMTVHNRTAVALYLGTARLWQDANVITAPSIEFDRDHRFVKAQGDGSQPVATVLVQADEQKANMGRTKRNSDVANALTITSSLLTYADAERKAHYEGNVVAQGSDFTASAKSADAYLLSRSQPSHNQQFAGPGQLDHMVATGNIAVRQGARQAEGQQLMYTAADQKFVLTGGSPSIFDAEHGKITGVSLTFFNRDDRVLVEGEANAPVVTQTRVAR